MADPHHDDATSRQVAARLQRLQGWRGRPNRESTLAFLSADFKRDVERPFKQLEDLAELWREVCPPELLSHTRLISLSRGILRVGVTSSNHLYELDRHLRGGLERLLITRHRGKAVRRVMLRVQPGEF